MFLFLFPLFFICGPKASGTEGSSSSWEILSQTAALRDSQSVASDPSWVRVPVPPVFRGGDSSASEGSLWSKIQSAPSVLEWGDGSSSDASVASYPRTTEAPWHAPVFSYRDDRDFYDNSWQGQLPEGFNSDTIKTMPLDKSVRDALLKEMLPPPLIALMNNDDPKDPLAREQAFTVGIYPAKHRNTRAYKAIFNGCLVIVYRYSSVLYNLVLDSAGMKCGREDCRLAILLQPNLLTIRRMQEILFELRRHVTEYRTYNMPKLAHHDSLPLTIERNEALERFAVNMEQNPGCAGLKILAAEQLPHNTALLAVQGVTSQEKLTAVLDAILPDMNTVRLIRFYTDHSGQVVGTARFVRLRAQPLPKSELVFFKGNVEPVIGLHCNSLIHDSYRELFSDIPIGDVRFFVLSDSSTLTVEAHTLERGLQGVILCIKGTHVKHPFSRSTGMRSAEVATDLPNPQLRVTAGCSPEFTEFPEFCKTLAKQPIGHESYLCDFSTKVTKLAPLLSEQQAAELNEWREKTGMCAFEILCKYNEESGKESDNEESGQNSNDLQFFCGPVNGPLEPMKGPGTMFLSRSEEDTKPALTLFNHEGTEILRQLLPVRLLCMKPHNGLVCLGEKATSTLCELPTLEYYIYTIPVADEKYSVDPANAAALTPKFPTPDPNAPLRSTTPMQYQYYTERLR